MERCVKLPVCSYNCNIYCNSTSASFLSLFIYTIAQADEVNESNEVDYRSIVHHLHNYRRAIQLQKPNALHMKVSLGGITL